MSGAIDLNDVRLLKTIVEHGSFAATATATGMAKSTISQRIAALEKASGTGLLRRTSRLFSLTEAGELLLPHARALDEVARQVEASLLRRQGGLRGTLRISCPSALCQTAFPTLLPRFLALHGDASLRVQPEASNQSGTMGAGLDLVIREHIRPLEDSSLLRRVVARVSWILAAAPAWLRANPAPDAPDEVPAAAALASLTLVEDRAASFSREGVERSFGHASRLRLDDPTTLRALAIAGAGVACLPRYLLVDALRTGALVPLMTDWRPPQSTITVLTPPKAQSSPLASAFSDYLSSELPRFLMG